MVYTNSGTADIQFNKAHRLINGGADLPLHFEGGTENLPG